MSLDAGYSPILIREGSSLYYSLLWTNPESRQRFCNSLNLINTLSTTLDDIQEPQIAEKKIHWWHEELQRLRDGAARHPATQAYQSELLGIDAAQTACLSIISAASTQRFTPAESETVSHRLLLQSYQPKLALLAHALSQDTHDLQAGLHPDSIAMAFARYEQLSRLPALLHRSQAVFSAELYKRFNVQPTDLAKHIPTNSLSDTPDEDPAEPSLHSLKRIPIVTDNPGRHQLLSHVIEQTLETFTHAINSREVESRYRRDKLLPLWRMLILRQRQMIVWQKKQPDLLRERMTLTPLHKLFYAWRHRK